MEATISSKVEYLADVIIPTYDNLEQLKQTIKSMVDTTEGLLRFIVVNNNSDIPIKDMFRGVDNIIVVNSGDNLGWTGGLAKGLEYSESDFVVFANDDIFVPLSERRWLDKMVKLFKTNKKIGAIGPSSNCVAGAQNMWSNGVDRYYDEVPFLIGFCIVIRREALDKCGGVDIKWETGDDIDLSIRFRDAGYGLLLDRTAFVYHHGFQTGQKIYGGPSAPGGWNSPEMTDNTNMNLIKEHGFMKWWEMMHGKGEPLLKDIWYSCNSEGDKVRKLLGEVDPSRVLELGCGDSLTIEGSFASDKKLDYNDYNEGIFIGSDHFDYVIARHIIEHLIDPIYFVEEIKRVLTDGGTAIFAVPDEEKVDGLGLDPTHLHVFTEKSLHKVIEAGGLDVVRIENGITAMSFIIMAKKKEN